ncbi:hypothetical protein CEXT_803331 [Caerostris extrusa]|uniref:Uncharacterized protein n=1 Tax=Caerostris extrusa TaxID=172846 RepID=A0AAV4R0E8_CAEEX|nr:hypothetical protein CEXT_803331 [Caerostris extrusa]
MVAVNVLEVVEKILLLKPDCFHGVEEGYNCAFLLGGGNLQGFIKPKILQKTISFTEEQLSKDKENNSQGSELRTLKHFLDQEKLLFISTAIFVVSEMITLVNVLEVVEKILLLKPDCFHGVEEGYNCAFLLGMVTSRQLSKDKENTSQGSKLRTLKHFLDQEKLLFISTAIFVVSEMVTLGIKASCILADTKDIRRKHFYS